MWQAEQDKYSKRMDREMKNRILTILITVCIAVPVSVCTYCAHQRDQTEQDIDFEQYYVVDDFDIEAAVFGVDSGTDFVPGFYEISPVDEYFETLELMARCMEAEAGNQGYEGKRLVAAVILNRVNHPNFPDTVRGVITQKYAFTSYWNGAMDRAEPTEETWDAMDDEIRERSNTKILYFTCEGYSEYGTPWKKIGDHYFSTE